MSKASYNVRADPENNANNTAEKDTSFRSFICALLIFLALCLIIFLAALNWKNIAGSEDDTSDSHQQYLQKEQDVEEFSGDGNKTAQKSDKIIVLNVPPPTLRTTTKRTTIWSKLTTQLPLDKEREQAAIENDKDNNEVDFTTSSQKSIIQKEFSTEYNTQKPVETTRNDKANYSSTIPAYDEYEEEEIEEHEYVAKPVTSKFTTADTPTTVRKETTTEQEYLSTTTVTEDVEETKKPLTTARKETTTEQEYLATTEGISTTVTEDVEETKKPLTTARKETTTKSSDFKFSSSQDYEYEELEEDEQRTNTIITEEISTTATDEVTIIVKDTTKLLTTTEPIIEKSSNRPIEETTDVKDSSTISTYEYEEEEEEEVENVFKSSNILSLNETKETTESTVDIVTATESKNVEELVEVETVSKSFIGNSTNEMRSTVTESGSKLAVDNVRVTTEAAVTETDFQIEEVVLKSSSPPSENITSPKQTDKEVSTDSSLIDFATTSAADSSASSHATSGRKIDSSILFTTKQEAECRDSVCSIAASRMLSLMNHSASPCEDFYDFACGGSAHVNAESADSYYADMLSTKLNSVHNSSPKYLKDFRNFYRGCLEHEDYFKYNERIEGVGELLKQVGQFQVEGSASNYDLTDLFAKLILRQSMPLFDIGLDVDKQSANFILQLTLPQESSLKVGLKSWSALSLHKSRCLKQQQDKIDSFPDLNQIYEAYVNCQKNYTSYLNSIENVVRELGIFADLTPDQLLKEVKDIRFSVEFQVLDQIRLLPSSGEIRRVFVKREYDVRKVSDLQAQYPVLEWKRLLRILTGHPVDENVLVQVYFGEYFSALFKGFAIVDRRSLNNAFLAIYVNDLFLNTVVTQELLNREEFCMDLSKKLLPDVWSFLVNSEYSNEERSYQETVIRQLFGILKDEKFCKSLVAVDWISSQDLSMFKKKCDNLSLGLFNTISEDLLLRNYDYLNITQDYQKDLIELMVQSRQTIYSHERTPVGTDKLFSYFLDPLESKPLSFYTNDMIVIPLGLLKKAPVGLPGYLVMARVGFHLAQEIARHFDPTGIKYDLHLTGTSKSSYNDFVAITSLNTTRYMFIQNHNISFNAGIALSTNERIRENAAFRLVLDSFNLYGSKQLLPWLSSTYSREKIVFIASAQEYCKKTSILEFMVQIFEDSHLPPVLAVENIMSNSEPFAEKFMCGPGSGMNLIEDSRYQFPYLPKIEETSYENVYDG